MVQVRRKDLGTFTAQELKEELLSRGASKHSQVASMLIELKKDLGGRADLAGYSTREIGEAFRATQKVIYGTDNRRDLFQVVDPNVRANSEGVVSLFRASAVRDNGDGTSTLQVGNFGKINSLCEQEPFFNQPVGAFCTGFLVGADIIATAGHCVNENNVSTIRFVFGFQMLDSSTARVKLDNSEIFAGAAVVGRKLTERGTDWSLVRLDRPASSKHILTLRQAGKISDEARLYVIGHPSGLPIKFADEASVRSNSDVAFFTSNLDTYGGNSGSPVFNAATHAVEGVLVRGSTDFVPMGNCMISAVCPTNGCEGEDCTRVSEFLDQIP